MLFITSLQPAENAHSSKQQRGTRIALDGFASETGCHVFHFGDVRFQRRYMAFVLFLAIGFVISLVARLILSGGRKLSRALTIWLGIAGALIGGLVMSFLTLHRVTEVHTLGVLGSAIGAIVVLAAGGVFRRTAVAQ